MSILSSIGKAVPALDNERRAIAAVTKTLTAAGIGIGAATGFSKGLSQSGAKESFYEMTTGNPNIDQEVLGTNLNPVSALLQLPGSKADRGMNGVMGMRSGLPKLLATLPTGFVNTKMAGYAFANAGKPFSQMQGSSDPYAANIMPSADGSLVFGLNNARHGG